MAVIVLLLLFLCLFQLLQACCLNNFKVDLNLVWAPEDFWQRSTISQKIISLNSQIDIANK